MSIKTVLSLFLLLGLCWNSCEKSDIYHSRDFDKSYQKWLEFKEATGNSYRYQIVTSSWGGYTLETTLTVEKGEVADRHFRWIIAPQSGMDTATIPKGVLEWTETGEESRQS